jgi:hypothetical protein
MAGLRNLATGLIRAIGPDPDRPDTALGITQPRPRPAIPQPDRLTSNSYFAHHRGLQACPVLSHVIRGPPPLGPACGGRAIQG